MATVRTSIERLADDAPVPHSNSWPSRNPPSIAYNATCAALEAQAALTIIYLVKGCARAYAWQPRCLEDIAQGLANLSPSDRITVLRQFRTVQVMRGGGEVPAVNRRGAMLDARYWRAKAHKIDRKIS